MFPSGITGFVTAVFLLKFATSGAYMVVGLSAEMHKASVLYYPARRAYLARQGFDLDRATSDPAVFE